jgi:hypothetical protein
MPTQGNSVASGKLEKAQLISDESETIEFMFNPTELTFEYSVNVNSEAGARTTSGLPKVSFAYRDPCTLSISNIIFDTYEAGTSVLDYINKLKKAVQFSSQGKGSEKRPPFYIFAWGQQQYIRCFVTRLSYRLTRFLSDGTPVQARVDLTLTEIDKSTGK